MGGKRQLAWNCYPGEWGCRVQPGPCLCRSGSSQGKMRKGYSGQRKLGPELGELWHPFPPGRLQWQDTFPLLIISQLLLIITFPQHLALFMLLSQPTVPRLWESSTYNHRRQLGQYISSHITDTKTEAEICLRNRAGNGQNWAQAQGKSGFQHSVASLLERARGTVFTED